MGLIRRQSQGKIDQGSLFARMNKKRAKHFEESFESGTDQEHMAFSSFERTGIKKR